MPAHFTPAFKMVDSFTLPDNSVTYYPFKPEPLNPNPKPVLLGSCMAPQLEFVSPLHDCQPNSYSHKSRNKHVRFADFECVETFEFISDSTENCEVSVPMTPSFRKKKQYNKITHIKLAGGANPHLKASKKQQFKQNNLSFKHPVTNNDLWIVKVPGDGSCQFHALTYKTEISS